MKTKYLFIFPLILLIIGSFFLLPSKKTESKPEILVTIAPYKYFIEKLTDNKIKVKTLVPQEADPHGFEPHAKELVGLFSAKIWFMVGEPFENQFLPILQQNNPELVTVRLDQQVKHPMHLQCSHHCHEIEDLHFWMSPKILESQINTIADQLKELYPAEAKIIEQNLALIQQEFFDLNIYLKEQISKSTSPYLLVSHPAFGYFCRDYHLSQLSLENESQDPSPKEIADLYQTIKEKEIKTLFVQKQYNYKMSKITADSLHLKMIEVNPYKEDYFANMRHFGEHLGE